MTLDIIQKHKDKPWDWGHVSYNPNLTIEFIKNNPDKKWNFAKLSSHKNITMDIIENNPEMNWYHLYVKNNPNVDIMFYINKFKMFSWSVLFKSERMTMHLFKWFLEKYKNDELGWDSSFSDKDIWKYASKHPNITLTDIEENTDNPWNWDYISYNPNITREFVVKNIEKISWRNLSMNKFQK
jgi:hypothetical protein